MINIERKSQTWQNDVLIPLCQNIVGGIAISALTSTFAALLFNPTVATVQGVALLTGVIVTSGFTAIRFFGDDIGLLKSAYRNGQKSAEEEISRLQNMLYDAERKIEALEADPNIAIGTTRNNQQILDACADAEKIVRWAYGGQTVSRSACGRRGLGQKAWGRANQVLKNAGIAVNGQWNYDDENQALRALAAHFERRQQQSKQGNVVTPY